ncbi:MAG: hypothetical protein Q9217_004858 [Psora testacea]
MPQQSHDPASYQHFDGRTVRLYDRPYGEVDPYDHKQCALFTKEEFELIWAFLLYVRRKEGQMCIEIVKDGELATNNILADPRFDRYIDLAILGKIVHRSVWGVEGDLSPGKIFLTKFQQSFATTQPYRQSVEEDPKYWFHKVREAYAEWMKGGGSAKYPTMPQCILICTPDGKMHANIPIQFPPTIPYSEPSDDLLPQYIGRIQGESSTYTLRGPLVPKRKMSDHRQRAYEDHVGNRAHPSGVYTEDLYILVGLSEATAGVRKDVCVHVV